MKVRIGNGFDFHKIQKGYGLTLAGVFIECPFKIIAHSDGDIILHTVVDALLGALSLGDIGTFFPDSDPQWKGKSSVIFLNEALKLMHDSGFLISNIDITVICEFPKLQPIKVSLIKNLEELMSLKSGDVSIKATTTEKMGFLGRGEGIGCFATVCMINEN